MIEHITILYNQREAIMGKINIEFSNEDHKKLQTLAERNETSLTKLVMDAIKEKLNRQTSNISFYSERVSAMLDELGIDARAID
jgi:hypothetical protein